MNAGNGPPVDPSGQKPVEVLRKFVDVFAGKGWLNQGLRIVHRDRRYRVFIAHRINDHGAISWGFPCWAVCMVTDDRIIEDSHLSNFASLEPGVHEWLRCIDEEDFEIL
jgi:hypothetical protein